MLSSQQFFNTNEILELAFVIQGSFPFQSDSLSYVFLGTYKSSLEKDLQKTCEEFFFLGTPCSMNGNTR